MSTTNAGTAVPSKKEWFIQPLNHHCRVALYDEGNRENVLEPNGSASLRRYVDKNGTPRGPIYLTWITEEAKNQFYRLRFKNEYTFRLFEKSEGDDRIKLVVEQIALMPRSAFKDRRRPSSRKSRKRGLIVNLSP